MIYLKRDIVEMDLIKGEYITDIEMVDQYWWIGTSSKGWEREICSQVIMLILLKKKPVH